MPVVSYTTNQPSAESTALGAYDLSLATDLSADCRVVSGRMALAEALIRRWSTPRGRLIDDPNYGTSLADSLNDDMRVGDIVRLQAAAEAEARKDERVADISSTALFVGNALTLTFSITDGEGPFTLTIAVTSVSVSLLQVSQ